MLNGRADGDSIDYFFFKAKQGQRLLIQCWAERIDSKMDATLAIDNSEGRELVSDRDTLGRDPVLSFTAPNDGDYFLRVYDFTFGGGDEHYYRLQVSGAPHIDFIVPPAGKPGTKGRYKLYGRNLPGGSIGEGLRLGTHELESLEVEIQLPSESQVAASSTPIRQALLPGFDYRLTANGTSSNPIRIGFSTEPIVKEIESTTDQAITLPAEVHGTFAGPGDSDRLLFEAKKARHFGSSALPSDLEASAIHFSLSNTKRSTTKVASNSPSSNPTTMAAIPADVSSRPQLVIQPCASLRLKTAPIALPSLTKPAAESRAASIA